MESNQLAVSEQKSSLIMRAQEQMEIAKRLIVNGKKLQDDEVRALAVYTAQTGLNISMNECYYMPGTGPIPGIAGIRRLAKEAAMTEANDAKYRLVGKGYRLEFVSGESKKLDAVYDTKKGDIAYECILTSDMDEAFWLNKLFSVMDKFSAYKLDFSDAKQKAIELIGNCPKISYVGVVYGSEVFSYNGKPEKMDRHERAKKRAEKGALKKRFALQINVEFEEPEEFIEMEILNGNSNAPLLDNSNKTTNELISELGFEVDPEIQTPPPLEWFDEPESMVETAVELGGIVKNSMTLEMAISEVNSDGVKYGDLPTDKLQVMANALAKKLKSPMGDIEREDRERKLDACRVILESRQ